DLCGQLAYLFPCGDFARHFVAIHARSPEHPVGHRHVNIILFNEFGGFLYNMFFFFALYF
ncbi:hypothetical protein ACQ1Q5_10625, partial [Ornithobacterium rhinotracheale]